MRVFSALPLRGKIGRGGVHSTLIDFTKLLRYCKRCESRRKSAVCEKAFSKEILLKGGELPGETGDEGGEGNEYSPGDVELGGDGDRCLAKRETDAADA